MFTTEVEICNYALFLVGQDSITSLSQNKKTARMCNLLYKAARRECLQDHFWNFAMKRAVLGRDSSTPLYEYTYQFTIPTDCIKIKDLDGDPERVWEEEDNKIITHRDAVYMNYVFDQTAVSRWSPQFAQGVAERLASKLCYPLTQSRSLAKDFYDASRETLKNARSLDGQVGHIDAIDDNQVLKSRAGAAGYYNGIDLSSATTRPQLSSTERDNILNPPTGFKIYNTTTQQNEVYNGSSWVAG